MRLAYLPSPARGVWHLGPFPIRAYALCIILGIAVALAITRRRWNGEQSQVDAVVGWAVPFGLVGGRLYHVITDPELYFGSGRHPIRALYVWQGGLGIWGAVALGGVGAWIGCRRNGVNLPRFADAVAPAIAVAQGIGRFGNYFNQELFGRPSTLPWALRIDPAHRPASSPAAATYQPTFLYEALWDGGVALLVIWAGRRFRLNNGRLFALYVAAYTVGRAWIEYLRVDHANRLLGLRLNDWTALIVFTGAISFLALRHNESPTPSAPQPAPPEPSLIREDAEAPEVAGLTQVSRAGRDLLPQLTVARDGSPIRDRPQPDRAEAASATPEQPASSRAQQP